jgi:phasin family protein
MAKTSTRENAPFDVSKVFTELRLPGLDAEALAATQRKNFEALTQANQLAVQGAQTVLRRQLEIGREAVDEFSTIFRDLSQTNGSLEDRLAKQAAFSKQAIEKGLSNVRELTELVTKANTEALNVIAKRVTESLDEVRDYATKLAA